MANHPRSHRKAAPLAVLLLASLLSAIAPAPGRAQSCTQEQVATALDEGSAALRRLNSANTPRIDAKLRELQKARGWSDHDLDDKAYEQLEDATISAFDSETATLITRMETLSEPSAPLPVCERLVELRQTLDRLREIAQQKSRYLIAKLDRELAQSAAVAAPLPVPARPAVPAAPVVIAAPSPPAPPSAAAGKPAEPRRTDSRSPEPVATAAPAAPAPWTTTTRVDPTFDRPAPSVGPGALPQPAIVAPPVDGGAPSASEVYSREEIFAAGQGFFGKISSGLASVLDFAIQKAGQPSGYILGDEGGGAFLAGVRYGKGLLHLKGQPPVEIYWRGPSIGYDVGAAGSRLIVLVYNVRDPKDLFVHFGGLDGSAYLVGGVGLTFLTNGKKIMAPIRSGIGLRLGANIGYLKFSHKPSWNPF